MCIRDRYGSVGCWLAFDRRRESTTESIDGEGASDARGDASSDTDAAGGGGGDASGAYSGYMYAPSARSSAGGEKVASSPTGAYAAAEEVPEGTPYAACSCGGRGGRPGTSAVPYASGESVPDCIIVPSAASLAA